MDTDILVLTYDDIWFLTNDLAKKIRNENLKPDILIGIARGGLVVTRLLSDIMDNLKVAIIGVGFYTGINETEKDPILTQELSLDLTDQKVLLIDDVSDTGKSFEFAVKYLKAKNLQELKTAALHYKPQSTFKPDYFISETSKWIVYPWEYMEFTRLYFKKQLEKNNDKEAIIQNLIKLNIPEFVVNEVLEN
ncbi:MAG: phosphoribosyltransferase [Candidatus Heimdallarchaeota archaeon]|nr:phosphoribosyltransferase [Candidatus Heimdallarchaeota archaeon]MCK5183745.1 phosphoribosyltransferase [Candidatus Heimdallarchaeota archaeon]